MNRLYTFAFLGLLTASLQLSAASLSLAQMSDSEQKEAGIDKLSPEEMHALNTWLAKQVTVKQPVTQKNKLVHGEFNVKANQNLGRYITLDNGITYEIPSRSRKKTMAWKVGEKVRLVEPVYPTNFKLENIIQDQTVGGKIATSVPSASKEKSQKDVTSKEKVAE